MDNSKKEPQLIVIDATTDVVILDETTGVTDNTRRPITGARRQAIIERLAKEADQEKQLEEEKKRNKTKPTQS